MIIKLSDALYAILYKYYILVTLIWRMWNTEFIVLSLIVSRSTYGHENFTWLMFVFLTLFKLYSKIYCLIAFKIKINCISNLFFYKKNVLFRFSLSFLVSTLIKNITLKTGALFAFKVCVKFHDRQLLLKFFQVNTRWISPNFISTEKKVLISRARSLESETLEWTIIENDPPLCVTAARSVPVRRIAFKRYRVLNVSPKTYLIPCWLESFAVEEPR